MNRLAVANELVKVAKDLTAGSEYYDRTGWDGTNLYLTFRFDSQDFDETTAVRSAKASVNPGVQSAIEAAIKKDGKMPVRWEYRAATERMTGDWVVNIVVETKVSPNGNNLLNAIENIMKR